jgi:hypothetical protein
MAVRDVASRKRRIIAGCFAAQADKSILHLGRMERPVLSEKTTERLMRCEVCCDLIA